MCSLFKIVAISQLCTGQTVGREIIISMHCYLATKQQKNKVRHNLEKTENEENQRENLKLMDRVPAWCAGLLPPSKDIHLGLGHLDPQAPPPHTHWCWCTYLIVERDESHSYVRLLFTQSLNTLQHGFLDKLVSIQQFVISIFQQLFLLCNRVKLGKEGH